jgi:signal transduction histidine kinase
MSHDAHVAMASKRRFLLKAPAYRALLEAWLLSSVLFLLLILIPEDLVRNALGQGLIFLLPFTAFWCAMRLRFSEGSRIRQLLYELGVAGLLALLITTSGYLVVQLAGNQGQLEQGIFGIRGRGYYLLLSASAPLFLGFRVLMGLWRFWEGLRRRHLVWALTHIQIQLVIVFAVLGAVALALFVASANPAEPLDRLLYTILPLAGLSTVAIVLALVLVFPPAFVLAYLAARQMTRRLATLTAAAQALRQGQYGSRVPVRGQDEVAQLQADFNAMAAELERAVADLRAEQAKVEGLLRSRRELVAAVSHELRTPIATIRGYLDSLQSVERSSRPDELAHDLDTIREQIVRLQRLVDDLFTLSRAETEGLSIKLEPLDVCALVKQQVATMGPLTWQNNRIQLLDDCPPDLPAALGDRDRLLQVLANLIRNGIRHTPPGGIIVVSAAAESGRVQIQVCDTGEGIPEADRPYIWERFYRGDKARLRDHRGAGLGLAIVKELTEAMDGSVDVSSVPGEGSCFSVYLPQA